MNMNDILIIQEDKSPDVSLNQISYPNLPAKRIVIKKDKIMRFYKDQNNDFYIHSNISINPINETLETTDEFCQIQTDEENKDKPSANNKKKFKKTRGSPVTKGAIEERKRIRRRIGNFDQNQSLAWKYLSLIYGSHIKQDDLVRIAEYVSLQLDISIDRDAKRRKGVLIKWFDENWLKISPLFHCP